MDACCAVDGNTWHCDEPGYPNCVDRASSSDWLFGLWPGPPQRFEPTGTDTYYQVVGAVQWPAWGSDGQADLDIGGQCPTGGQCRPLGDQCHQGRTYRGTDGEICGGGGWGATHVEVWYPR